MGNRASRAWNPANVSITGSTSTGLPVLLSQSGVAVAAPLDTVENVVLTVAIPAGTLGSNGRLRMRFSFSMTSSVNNKTLTLRYSTGVIVNSIRTTDARVSVYVEMLNRNATNSQITTCSIVGTGATGEMAPTTSAIDSTAAQNLTFSVTKVTGAEVVQLESYGIEYIKASNA
jgi:hypothetical protein